MIGRFHIIGVAIGIIAAAVATQVYWLKPEPALPRDAGRMISECDGTIAELVIQYVGGDTVSLPVYRGFFPQLSSDVTVNVICPDQASFDELRAGVGVVACTLRPVLTRHPITVWSRDRWVALRPADTFDPITLLSARNEQGEQTWAARAGDAQVASDLASGSNGRIVARRLPIFFDGGDLLADASRVFVTPAVVSKNLGTTVESRGQLVKLLRQATGKDVVLLDRAPDHHAGMYMMAVDEHTMLVGDPRLARPLIGPSLPDLPGGPDWSEQTQAQFDAVASQVAVLGYRVVRIPTVVAPDAKTYLTYVNVIIDHRAGRRMVYLPCYRGADASNDSAAQVWRSLGYQVRPVDCTSCYQRFGDLHCLVNVLRRS